jgi:hypothetical protein
VFDPENRGAIAYRDLAKEVLGEPLDLDEPPTKQPWEISVDNEEEE